MDNMNNILDSLTEEEIENMSDEELDRLMNEAGIDLDSELEKVRGKEDSTGGADLDGTIVDSDALLKDDNTIVNNDNFISENGDIVVLDTESDGEKFRFEKINIENIAIVKRIRKNNTNVDALCKSIMSTGLLQPISVAATATEGIYVLLHGFRRLLACAKIGIREIPCVINLKVNVSEIPVIEAMYNHSKRYTNREIIDYIDYLEKQKGIMSASLIEYLLQLNNGDYTKLKDLLNDNDPDLLDKLYSDIYDIDTAFRKLEQRRKKESAEEKENKKVDKAYSDDSDKTLDTIAGSGLEATGEPLTEEEMKALAINSSDLENIDGTSLDDMVKEGNKIDGYEPNQQDYRNREMLDPALRKAVLARDNNTCACCGLSGQEYVEVFDIHHIIEVYLGGSDAIDNLIVLCTCCHKLVHLYARGELYIRPESEMTEQDKIKFKRIVKLGMVIRKGLEQRKMKKEDLKKLDKAETIGRTRPGTGQIAG